MKQKILFEQSRHLESENLNILCEGLSEYFLELNQIDVCKFEKESDTLWKYYVWAKEVSYI